MRRARVIRLGGLREHRFPAGWYVYTGSARNGLLQRLARHLRRRKRRHWHIDYLLAVADGIEALILPGTEVTECELHARLRGRVLVPGFGSSDCSCESHLAWFRRRPGTCLMAWEEFALTLVSTRE